MYETVESLALGLKTILKSRGLNIQDTSEDDYTLKYEVKRAINEINKCRRFNATDDKPYDKKYESLIIPLCICAYSKIGAEGESSHSENGVVRNYTTGGDYPKDMLNGIIPLIR